MLPFWKCLLHRWFAGGSGGPAGRRRPLVLESLEDRFTPSTLTVSNLLDHGAGSLRDQIAAAAPGDTIVFAVTGTISLTSGELDITQDLTIQGPGATHVTVNGRNAQRVFHIEPSAAVTISGLTIANGHVADLGAGIKSEGSLSLRDSTLSNNTAGAGGGGVAFVVNHAAALTVSGSMFVNNSAANGAGLYTAITNRSGQVTVTVTDSDFTTNTSTGFGGGLDSAATLSGSAGATVSITGGHFTNNKANFGGALAMPLHTADVSRATVNVSAVPQIELNAAQNGGGIDVELTSADSSQAVATFTGAALSANTASQWGGGLYDAVASADSGQASLTFTGVPMAGVDHNTAVSGGGIYSLVTTTGSGSGAARFNTADISANTASQSGGGLYSQVNNSGSGTATVSMTGANLSDNRAVAVQGGGVYSSVTVSGSGSADATLTSVAVTGSVAGKDGGGVYAEVVNKGGGTHLAAASTTLRSSTLSGNTGGDGPAGGIGGGLYLTVTAHDTAVATATLTGLTVTANTVRGNGAGMGVFVLSDGPAPASVSCDSLTVSGNFTNGLGGGIFVYMTGSSTGAVSMSVTNSTLSGNTAGTGGGGGLYATVGAGFGILILSSDGQPPPLVHDNATATLMLSNSTVSGNRVASGSAGGLEFDIATGAAGSTAQALVTGCTISGNTATVNGGGIQARETDVPNSSATVIVTNSTLYANRADKAGGLDNIGRDYPGTPSGLTLMSDTVAFNAAGSTGGGLQEGVIAGTGRFTVRSTIVAGNTGGTAADAVGTFVSGGHNLIGQTNGSSGWLASDLKGTAADPLDADFGDFGNFGGRTKTLSLSADSPAVGKGDPAGPATDQRGAARNTTAPTIGAFEVIQPASFQVFPAFPRVQAGIPFGVIVVVYDSNGRLLTTYTGTIHFRSSDPDAGLPADYTFTPADAGSHAFEGVTLATEGSQTLTVTGGGVTGTATVTVAALATFEVAPAFSTVAQGAPLGVTVSALGSDGGVLLDYGGTIYFASSDPGAALPADYTFVPADRGQHTFTRAVTFQTQGDQTLTVTGDGAAGTATVSVTAPLGTWTTLTHPAPSNITTMMLLTDGTVLAQGSASTPTWYKLTPDASGSYVNGTWSPLASMSMPRLYFASNVLPDGRVFLVGGEFTGSGFDHTNTNTGEIYDPVANTWTAIQDFPQHSFGDDPSALLPDGRVLAGYIVGAQTYIYDPATDSWTFAANKLRSDRSDEETWVNLPDGSVLSYDVFHDGHAQRYLPDQNQWVDTGTVPVVLSGSSQELGPAHLLPDGRVFFIGATSHTALYDPATDTWAAGPDIPGGLGADDAPGAMLPNGHVLFSADPPSTGSPTLFEFDPVANTMKPVVNAPDLGTRSFGQRMLMLPNGQVLFTHGTIQLSVYTPNGEADPAWRPTIADVADNGDGTFTLTGTQLNGISEGASYGDDAEMSSNYPIIRLVDADGHVFYARTFGWSVGVATGDTPVSTQFTLPAGIPAGTYSLSVVANGIASDPVDFTVGGGNRGAGKDGTLQAVLASLRPVGGAPDGQGNQTPVLASRPAHDDIASMRSTSVTGFEAPPPRDHPSAPAARNSSHSGDELSLDADGLDFALWAGAVIPPGL